MSRQPKRIIISGGGTGGHVFPAIAIADAIRQVEPDAEILFVGAKGRMEMDRVPKAGYRIIGLDIVGLQRRLSWKNLLLPFKLAGSLWNARNILRQFKPDVAVGVGGYASGPVLRVSANMGIPTLIQEQNSYAGMTNRILAKKAQRICVAYPGMDQFFPAAKIRLTGNPVRSDITELSGKRLEALQHYRLDPGKKVILLVGGSLGARSLNEAMDKGLAFLGQHPEIQVIWQIGKVYASEFDGVATARLEQVRPMIFIERMDLAYAAADLVVCRAGALTISELTLAAKAAILVPSPNVAEDHQTRNAESLSGIGAARLLPESRVATELWQEVENLLADPETLSQMAQKAAALGNPDAARLIAENVLDLIN